MKTLAFALLIAGATLAQDKQDSQEEKKTDTKAALQLTDAQSGTLGGFVADKFDTNPTAEDFEKSVLDKVVEVQKPASTTTGPAKGKGKKKAAKKAGKKGSQSTGDTIKNGLTDSDRQALGKFVVTEINADHKGQAFADAVKKELERLRAERVKASSSADTQKKKKKKKDGNS
jgi:hypothetical protein